MKIIKKIWPLLFIFIIWFAFSSPYFLKQKVPFPSSYLVDFFSPWNSYPGYKGPVKNNAMPDIISQIYPWKNISINSYKNLQIPLWNQFSFAGTNHLANYQSAVLSPLNGLFFIFNFIDAWSLQVLLQPLLAGLFMYIYLRIIKISSVMSTIGSVSFMFCGFLTTWMAYSTLGYAILYLPLALFFIEKFYNTKKFLYVFLLSLTLPLSFFSGHFQISLYFSLFIFAYLIFKFIEHKDKAVAFYTLLYFLLGFVFTLPQILPSLEAYSQALRSSIFQKTEIIPWGYIVTLLAPDFYGNPVTRNDWFGHYAEWNGFVGTITLISAAYVIFIKKTKLIAFYALVLLVTLLFAFQTPIADIVVWLKIPVLSTSAMGRIIVLFSFSMVVLACIGLEHLLKDLEKLQIKKILTWIIIVLTIISVLWIIVILKIFIPIDKINIAKQNLILPTLLIFTTYVAMLVVLVIYKLKKIQILFILPLIILTLVSFDLFRFVNKWMPFDSRELVYPKVLIEDEFKRISGYDRVFGNLGQEAFLYYNLSGIIGYDAVYINRYGEFIASLQNGDLDKSNRSVVSFPKNGLYSKKGLDLLGVKYFIHKISDGKSPWTFPFWNYQDEFKLRYDDGIFQVYENKSSMPRAYLVSSYEVKNDPQEIINAMFLDNKDLTKTVVLEKDPKVNLNIKRGSIAFNKYTNNEIELSTVSDGTSILFISDVYYPGWKAFINEKEVEVFRSNYAFRSVVLPKGNNLVKFAYDPIPFKLGLILAFIGFIFGLLIYKLRGRIILFPKI